MPPNSKLQLLLQRKLGGRFSDSEVITYLANKGITWCAITEFAPWMGGYYERLAGLVK